MSEYQDWHWRNSMRTPRFFALDARAAIPLAVLIVYFRVWTLVLALATAALFWILERKGLTFNAALRAIRVWFIGPKRPAFYWFRRRKLLDLDG